MHGPCVRWVMGDRTLALSREAGELQLLVRSTRTLVEADRAPFDADVIDFARLPFVWQVQAQGPRPWPPPQRVPAASDWLTLEASIEAVLRSCAEQVPEQLGLGEHLGFNITADGGRTVGVVSHSGEGLIVLVDDRGASGPTPPEEMTRRGWDRPLMGWWEHAVMEPVEVSRTAGMLVAELRHGGTETPEDLRTADMVCDRGTLLLPGLAVQRG